MRSNRLRLNPSKTELICLCSSRRLHHCSSTGMRVSDVDLRPVDCSRSGSPHRQWDDAGEARQLHLGCLFLPAPTTANHQSIPHRGRCSCSGTRAHTQPYRLLQRALVSCPRYLTDRLQVVLRAAARMVLQLPYRSPVSEIMHQQLHWLDVVDRVNYKIGLHFFKCLHGLAPGYLSDQCIPAPTFAGRDNMRSSTRLDTVRPTTQNEDTESTRVLLRLVCRVALSLSLRTCVIPDSRSTPSERTEISLFHS